MNERNKWENERLDRQERKDSMAAIAREEYRGRYQQDLYDKECSRKERNSKRY